MLAKALRFAGDELGAVALMQHDVVDHVRRRHDPTLQAEPTQRFGFELMLAQPSPARSFVEVLPRNRVTTNRHDALFHNAARFLDELLKQAVQVQLGSQFPLRQNGEGAIGFAIEAPMISGESPFALFSPFAARRQWPSGAPGVPWSGVAISKDWQRPDLDSERFRSGPRICRPFSGSLSVR